MDWAVFFSTGGWGGKLKWGGSISRSFGPIDLKFAPNETYTNWELILVKILIFATFCFFWKISNIYQIFKKSDQKSVKKTTFADPKSKKSKNAPQTVYFHEMPKLEQKKSILEIFRHFCSQNPHQNGVFGVLKWLYLDK